MNAGYSDYINKSRFK